MAFNFVFSTVNKSSSLLISATKSLGTSAIDPVVEDQHNFIECHEYGETRKEMTRKSQRWMTKDPHPHVIETQDCFLFSTAWVKRGLTPHDNIVEDKIAMERKTLANRDVTSGQQTQN